MRYHLLLNTFGRIVKIKKTYFPYSEGAYIFFHDCKIPMQKILIKNFYIPGAIRGMS